MTCMATGALKYWTVYNALSKQFIHLSHEEFKDYIQNKPIKLMGRYLKVNNLEKIWIDGILNSAYFK